MHSLEQLAGMTGNNECSQTLQAGTWPRTIEKRTAQQSREGLAS